MKAGMLWYIDERGKELVESIANAVDHFKQKYGHEPFACYVHPASLDAAFKYDDKLKVIPNDSVNRNHLWLEFPESP